MIFQVFLLKRICFSVFLLNSIEDKDSRFNSAVQFHLMALASFPFRIQISGTVFSFYQGFLSRKLTGHQGKGGEHFLFHSTTSIR